LTERRNGWLLKFGLKCGLDGDPAERASLDPILVCRVCESRQHQDNIKTTSRQHQDNIKTTSRHQAPLAAAITDPHLLL